MNNANERIMTLEAQVAELQNLLKGLFRNMTVDSFDADADRVVAIDEAEGDDENGPTESAPIRLLSQAGAVSHRSTVSKGQQVLAICPTGKLDEMAFVIPFGQNEANPSASNEAIEDITTVGNTTSRLHGQGAELLGNKIDLGSTGGKRVARIDDEVEMEDGTRGKIVTASSSVFAGD